MFPRPRKITRLLLAVILVAALLGTSILNLSGGSSSSSSLDPIAEYAKGVDGLRVQSSRVRQTLNFKPRTLSDIQHLQTALANSRHAAADVWPGETSEAKSFIRTIMYRLSTAGIRAIREMKQADPVVKVKPPVPSVNPHDFRYIHNPSQICSNRPSLTFLIYIHSATGNLKRRQIIRQTWGNPQLLALFNASMIFALGAPADPAVQKMVDMEQEGYGDLLQEDYRDAYRNLTYKGMSVLKWASNHCSQPLFFIKTDDDILLDIVSIIDHILTKMVPERGARKLVLCNLWTTMKVIRDPKSKWGLSKEEFPHDIFPPYCSGSAFVLSGDLVPQMYDKALRSPFFWVDDYFISGVLVNALGVKHERFNPAYLLNGLQVEEKIVNDTSRKFMVMHIKKYSLFLKVWKLIMKRHHGMSSFLQNFSNLDTPDLQKGFARTRNSTFANVTSSSSSLSLSSSSSLSVVAAKSRLRNLSVFNRTKPVTLRNRPAAGG